MKLMQTNKGEFGYLKRERKRRIIIAAIMLGVPVFIFISMWKMCIRDRALRSLEGKGVFDCIFMDPPYNHELERQVLEYLQDSSILDENTLIIVEADLTTDFGYVEDLGYRQLRSKEYKTNKHIFLCRGK